ncbi:MAG: (2Fe-2S)-binding protein [Deltaproteobacteria bacterium]|nr:(2Fe-2S)-binding protein [Deltaproteobacteria bacterium]
MADGSITIDGREIPFDRSESIIAAATRAGIRIPHYCWHPGLSAPANCRMCLVEILPAPGRPVLMLDILRWDPEAGRYERVRKPKLMPACQVLCENGMQVKADSSEHVRQARRAVQEMLLLDHPVDCPICDQAGECALQDYWREHQHARKRMLDEPVHKPKRVPFGRAVVYDAERCVLCTRCIRISRELGKDPVLGLRERGHLKEVVLSPGRELAHDYSLMTAHACPVGALTARHFRFKARAWLLRSGPTICQGCATGCNAHLDYDPRTGTPLRYRPRTNLEINRYWMCDEGMLSYARQSEARLCTALVGGEEASIDEALAAAREQLGGHEAHPEEMAIVLSAQHSCEDNLALGRLARGFLKGTGVAAGTPPWRADVFLSRCPDGRGDDVLRSADKNPNTAGVRRVLEMLGGAAGYCPRPFAELVAALAQEKYRYVISLGAELDVDEAQAKDLLSRTKAFVVIASREGPLTKAAHIALPAASWAEAAGTYVNRDGIAQRAAAVLPRRGVARPGWELVHLLGRALGYGVGLGSRREIEQAMTESAGPGAVPAETGAAEVRA